MAPPVPATASITIRPVAQADKPAWLPLWAGYNAFYAADVPQAVTNATWQRFHDPYEPVHALVAEQGGRLVGLVHYLFHRGTSVIEPICYLEDLFSDPAVRGQGVGRALIEAVYAAVRAAGGHRVYWQTRDTNTTARALYDGLARHEGFIVYSHRV